MTYSETIEYLYNSAPLFQNIGADAYKEGLGNSLALDAHHGHPHQKYKCIHVAGTNGKGSVSHTIAAILKSQGYKVGLYTSPHLLDFRERIRVNGEMISQERVIRFVQEERTFFEPLHPSFFELTTALALTCFAEQEVDYAVIEVGLGGRLDCTNIITPILSIITNISKDHVQFLGDTLPRIASEKAGIIKQGVPVVIGETGGNSEVRAVFQKKAEEMQASISYADELTHEPIQGQLTGACQVRNTQTILTAIDRLRELDVRIDDSSIADGFMHVCDLTGLMGRWQQIQTNPTIVCDTGHNTGGWSYLGKQLAGIKGTLHMIIGMVGDKDVTTVLSQMPAHARYYFTEASVKRAMPVGDFARIARSLGLEGDTYPSVEEAISEALHRASPDDFIFVGGSTFIVADFLQFMRSR